MDNRLAKTSRKRKSSDTALEELLENTAQIIIGDNNIDENKMCDESQHQTETEMKTKRRKLGSVEQLDEPPKTALELKAERKKQEILGYRTSNEELFIENGIIKRLKTSILIDSDQLSIESTDSSKLHAIPSHRPIIDIVEKSRAGSPVTVLTPKMSTLHRVGNYGCFSIFSNGPKLESIKNITHISSIDKENDFFSSPQYDAIHDVHKKIKFQKTKITHKMLEERRSEDEATNYRRSISQNKIMATPGSSERSASATDYVNATKLFADNMRWEWLHLIAHMVLGKISQDEDNLVAGSKEANTEMMFAEANLNYLSRVYPNGFDLEVKATLIQNTHIATTIEYIIKTKDFTFNLLFNAQTHNKPHIHFLKYFDFITRELVKLNISKTSASHDLGATFQTDVLNNEKQPILFFNKPTLKVTKLSTIQEKPSLPHPKPKPIRQVALDTETTGLNPDEGDRVVEIACVELMNGRFTGKQYRQYLNPERSIPKFLKKKGIHNITDDVVKNKPKFAEIADDFLDFIKDAELIGHNLPFDLRMIENELELAGRSDTLVGRYAIDTLAMAQEKLPIKKDKRLRKHRLNDLCEFYGIDLSERKRHGHGALIDAILCAQLYLCMTQGKKILSDIQTPLVSRMKNAGKLEKNSEAMFSPSKSPVSRLFSKIQSGINESTRKPSAFSRSQAKKSLLKAI